MQPGRHHSRAADRESGCHWPQPLSTVGAGGLRPAADAGFAGVGIFPSRRCCVI
ncbi:hypothetical protein GJR88_02618 [Dietzia sp. DQ12-45-1b]|nr:hypothetical protein GJR88_02618 [Dietzia sp. DQ12-45-1b]